jgi:anti-sigma regulatory factor (Ser/Thr protein kinase)
MGVIVPASHMSSSIAIVDTSGVGEARRFAVALAEHHGFSEQASGRLALIVTEAASNTIQHGGGGEILLRAWTSGALDCCIEVLALDKGPGMTNVAVCMRDGFSTGGSRGVGLGAIARLSTSFDVFSAAGKGTALLARVGDGSTPTPTGPGLEWGAVCVAKREEIVSGDAWAVQERLGVSTVLVVDGLGHGPAASEVARKALQTFESNEDRGPERLLRRLDADLRGTRGAAIAVAELDWTSRTLCFAGVGNIAGTLLTPGTRSRSLVSYNGTAGQAIERLQEFSCPWPVGGLMLMHSDGLSPQWELDAYPGLSAKSPSLIAAVLYRDFVRRRDDVVVVAVRERVPARGERPDDPT